MIELTEEEQRILLGELYGFSDISRINKYEFSGLVGVHDGEKKVVPSFTRDLNYLHKLCSKLGLMERNDQILRVKWVNNLRTIVSRRMPKNKSGTALTTDVDLLLAEPEEIAESILKTFSKKV